ncbi:Smr/MutS family protein [Hymenobacter sp. ASUV-10]|uniref:Smr/MutS family protein n=1 Tax=Hymenobacter aranciens TaxID=3063996 RepID=A0ABT9BF70_9BACT|nr:Smr/MutS family protein [Hymenobacter sp. ASUV-10]MDO7876339.1 Smr/MutS family protein [Hymenobacter sp. ASUV-10]
MNVGDRVRLLTGTEQGIVTRLLDNELVEVAIDNDFTIPVLRREVVVIAAEEGQSFTAVPTAYRPGKANQNPGRAPSKKDNTKRPAPVASNQGAAPAKAATPSLAEALAAVASSGPGAAKAKPTPTPTPQAAPKGVFLALVPQSPELLAVTLINNTEAEVLFTYGEETAGRPYRALAADKLAAKASSKALSFLHLKDFEAWPAAVVQLLPFRLNGDAAFEVLNKRQAFKATTFYSSKKPAPVIGKDAYLYQLDEKAATAIAPEKLAEEAPAATLKAEPTVDIQALKAQLTGDAPAKPAAVVAAVAPAPAKPVVAPPHEFDLHLEALRPNNTEELSNTAILRLQLDAFEDALSRALATNMHEIIFIHGLGNGTLRKEIHRQLSRNKDIKFFEDAQKGKFGYGATLVRLK